jgi:hypothetical protein
LLGNVDAQAASYEPIVPSEHTCRWIYTNMTIDATRRVIPCCAAPAKGYDLVFATFGENFREEVFNSEKYRLARLYFSNPKAYSAERALRVLNQDPHCVNCIWDQDHVNVSNEHVNQYLRDVAGNVLNDQSMQILCSW